MLADVLIFLLSAIGCSLVYATSKHQQMFKKQQFRWQQLPRSVVWVIFVFSQFNSILLLAEHSSWGGAAIKVFAINMVLWISLILLSAYWPLKPLRVSSAIFSGFLCLLFLGV